MSLRHAILGFLSYKSLTGYDLKKAFDQSVRHFWPADRSQIYRTLKQLHKEKLISQEVIPREEQMDVKVYAITESGRQELEEWLSTPLELADTREPFLIQLYFAFMLQDEQARHLLQTEIEQIDSLLPMYQEMYQNIAGRSLSEEEKRPIFYSILTLEYGIRANHWYRGWPQSVLDRIESGNMSVLPLGELLETAVCEKQPAAFGRPF